MKYTTKLGFAGNVLFTLFFTSLLSSGVGLSLSKSAIALTDDAQTDVQLISQSTQISQKRSERLPRRITRQILRDAAKRSGVPVRKLKIEDATSKIFGNPCIFNFGEICTREFNPIEGWEVIVRIKDKSVTYHIDLDGTQIVLDPNANLTASTKLPQNLATAVLQDASERSGVPLRNLKIQKANSKTFSNPCAFNFGEICTQEFNPVEGWEVFVRVQRKSVIYHINETGSQVVLDPNANL